MLPRDIVGARGVIAYQDRGQPDGPAMGAQLRYALCYFSERGLRDGRP